MGYFDGFGENLTHAGPDGARYFAPVGRWGPIYRVPDASEEVRLRRRWVNFVRALFFVGLASIVILGPTLPVVLAVGPIGGLLAVALGFWFARGFPKSTVVWSELERVSRTQAVSAYSKAVGRRTLLVLLVISALMALAGVLMLVFQPGLQSAFAAGFFVLCTVSAYIQFRQAS